MALKAVHRTTIFSLGTLQVSGNTRLVKIQFYLLMSLSELMLLTFCCDSKENMKGHEQLLLLKVRELRGVSRGEDSKITTFFIV